MWHSLVLVLCTLFSSVQLPSSSPKELDDDAYRTKLYRWIGSDCARGDPDANFPFEQPERTASMLVDVLRYSEGLDRYRLERAITLAGSISQHVGEEPIDRLRPLIASYLTHQDFRVRSGTVQTFGTVGNDEDLPLLTVMLSDKVYQVHLAAIVAIGKIGGPQAMLVLDIWEQRQAELDKARPEDERWLNPAIRQALDIARRQGQAEPVPTQPATRGEAG